jgi:murein DD-endopeptidase
MVTSPLFPPPPTTSSSGSTKRRRGLFDTVLTLVLVYAVYASTPVGAVAETAINIARGQKDRPSWLSTFKGRETAVSMSSQAVVDAKAAIAGVAAPIAVAASAHNVDPEALAAIISVHGACTETACDAEAPPRIAPLVPGTGARASADQLARAMAAAHKELPGAPASLAIEALYVGTIPVKLAVEQARRSAIEDPLDVEAHAEFFTPSARRGPLQAALAVLAVHRLRTLAWPAATTFRITSPFGERIHPVTGKKSFHNGTDVGTPTGTSLIAAAAARVKRQSQDSVSGNYVVLDLGLGIETVYCHLSEPRVTEGTRVPVRGEVGLSGATGRVTGPHLHYILRVQGSAVDAQLYGEGTRVGARPTSP